MRGTKFLAHLFYFLQKGIAMLEELKQEQQPVQTTKHPYQQNQEPTVCDLNDKECLQRLVAAFSDCD